MDRISIPLPNPGELFIISSMRAKDGAQGWILQPITVEAFLDIPRQALVDILAEAEVYYVSKYERENDL